MCIRDRLYNDRRCGALFFRGFIHERDMGAASGASLWRYPGQTLDGMKEIHLFLPEEDYRFPLKQGKFALLPCYLDVKSGFINFRDDLWENQPNVRKLYYSRYQAKGRPQTLTFTTVSYTHLDVYKRQTCGRLFDSANRKMLPEDADVQIGKQYYYLSATRMYRRVPCLLYTSC